MTALAKELEEAIKNIRKAYGDGAVMTLGETPKKIEVIPSGSLTLDKALGVGGYPKGRITEIYGPESSGKTTLAYHAIAEAQKQGGTCAFIDVEHSFDPNYAKNIGVDIENLVVAQPDTGEEALSIAEDLIRSGKISVMVLDSVAALVPRAEVEAQMGASVMGSQARLMSQAMRKITGIICKTNTVAIFINQIRMKIGVVYGNPETTSGGNALKFFSSVRLDIRKAGGEKSKIEGANGVVGNRTRVKVVKNKVAPPFKETEFDIIYNEGISRMGELIDLGVFTGVINKSGAWYSYNDEKIGQGKEAVKEFLKHNPDIASKIEKELK